MLVADEWQLNLSYEQAEEIKIKYGIPAEGTTEKTKDGIPLIHILEMISPTLRRLKNEILRSFDYYKDQFREEKIDKVLLTGGSSKLKGLDAYLSDALGITVEILEPLKNIEMDGSLKPKEEKLNECLPRLSLSIGLALGKAIMINFLRVLHPPKKGLQLPGFLSKIQLPARSLVAIGVGILALAIGFNVYLTSRRDMYRRQLQDKQVILADIKALHERKNVLSDIARKETHVRSMLVQLTKTFPSGITLTNLIYDNGKKQIWLTGTAAYTGLVGKLIKNLEDSGYFRDVKLLEIKQMKTTSGKSDITFRTTLFLE